MVLSVEDDGAGLEAATTREASTGMGTRFVDAFVRQLGGTPARASGPKGTTISIRLPAAMLQ